MDLSPTEEVVVKTVTYTWNPDATEHPLEWHLVDSTVVKCAPDTRMGQVKRIVSGHLHEVSKEWARTRGPNHALPSIPDYWRVGVQEQGVNRFYFPHWIDLLGSQGEVVFAQYIDEVDFADVRAASDAGLLGVEIEPNTVILGAFDTGANGPEWAALLESWLVWNEFYSQVIASAMGSLLAGSACALLRALAGLWKRYRDRNGRPGNVLAQLLAHERWPVQVAMIRFSMSEDDVGAVLSALGFVPCPEDPSCYQILPPGSRRPDDGHVDLGPNRVEGFIWELPPPDVEKHPVVHELCDAYVKYEQDRQDKEEQ